MGHTREQIPNQHFFQLIKHDSILAYLAKEVQRLNTAIVGLRFDIGRTPDKSMKLHLKKLITTTLQEREVVLNIEDRRLKELDAV